MLAHCDAQAKACGECTTGAPGLSAYKILRAFARSLASLVIVARRGLRGCVLRRALARLACRTRNRLLRARLPLPSLGSSWTGTDGLLVRECDLLGDTGAGLRSLRIDRFLAEKLANIAGWIPAFGRFRLPGACAPFLR